MGRAHRSVGALALLVVVAGCATSGGGPTAPASTPAASASMSTSAPTTAPATTLSQAPTAVPTTAPTPAPTPVPTGAGPVVLASTLYPYRLTVPSGPTSFVAAHVPWDGVQKLSSDSLMTDHVRAPGVGLVWIVMTDTTDAIDAVAPDVEAKFRFWHGCTAAISRREFTVGVLKGVGLTHTCAGGEPFVRAVVVGRGHALVAFSAGGPDPSAQLGRLIELFGGLEWAG